MVLSICALILEVLLMATFGVFMAYAPLVYLILTPAPVVMAIISLVNGIKATKNNETRAKGIKTINLSKITLLLFSLLIIFILVIILPFAIGG